MTCYLSLAAVIKRSRSITITCLWLSCSATVFAAEPARFATYNIWELSREKLDRVDPTGNGSDLQLRNAASIIQTVRPDVLLINEIDFDQKRENAQLFLDRYLKVSIGGKEPIDYPFIVFEPVNTGAPSGLDLNRNGKLGDPEDAWGYGRYPGQYGMALLSRYPIQFDSVRTFRLFSWSQMPGHLIPDGQERRPNWYPPEIVSRLRLSSKSHWDVPVDVNGTTIHFLATHPTPPVFDGPEDRNGRRNHDEIRLWADYITGGSGASYLSDDQGERGGIDPSRPFVILGDLNSDPDKGEKFEGVAPIRQLLDHPRVQDPRPTSGGGIAANPRRPAELAALMTSNFGRLDYLLPSKELEVVGSGVFWPQVGEPLAPIVEDTQLSSDHRLVWVDIMID